MKTIVLIPSYEPGDILVQIARNICQLGYELVLVDDGSGPEYGPIFRQASVYGHVISYEENRGKGFALKTGLKYIDETYGDYCVITMDGDGQHLPEDVVRVKDLVEKHPEAFVIGSRHLPADAPLRSRMGNAITRFVYKTVAGGRVYDTQSGLRGFSYVWVSDLLKIPGDRYEYEMNVLLTIAKQQLPVREVPIEAVYLDATNSASHFDTLRDSLRIYSEILKFAASSFVSFLVDFGIYSLLIALLGDGGILLIAANLAARAVSSVVNFTINKKVVFQTSANVAGEAAKYFALVAFNIAVNSALLTILTARAGVNAYAAKIAVELVMFLFSYAIQHFLIFRKEKTKWAEENI